MSDLFETIQNAVDEATDTTVETVDTSTQADTTVETAPVEAQASTESTTPDAQAVASPAAKAEAPAEDDFSKRFGIPGTFESGRENRIPYSRVQKIVAKAEREKEDFFKKQYEGWVEPKTYSELQEKVKDYETRLQGVGQYEHVLMNQPDVFLQQLSEIPAYQPFFQRINELVEHVQGLQQAAPTAIPDDMPEPNETLPDGTRVYDMDGIKGLLSWNAAQVEKRLVNQFQSQLKQVESRYKPIEEDWQAHQRFQQLAPKVQAQIENAQKNWPKFTENEAEITQALAQDRTLTLEGAYQRVVVPKLQAERDRMRQELLAEIKSAPTSTAAPTKPAKAVVAPTGQRSLEDIIRESIKDLPR